MIEERFNQHQIDTQVPGMIQPQKLQPKKDSTPKLQHQEIDFHFQ